jgi:hypothetical protein
MGQGLRSVRLKHPMLAGLLVVLAAFAPSNASHAGLIVECAWNPDAIAVGVRLQRWSWFGMAPFRA